MLTKKNVYNEVPIHDLEQHYDRFRNDRLEDLVEIGINLDKNEYENILKVLHRWKGCCEPFGFGKLMYFADQIESFLVSKLYFNISQTLTDIKHYLIFKKR